MKALLGYYGGKSGPVGAWIAQQLPPHRVYVEPFGGMAGVLMQKRPSPVEVYNDLSRELVNLFRVVREQPQALREQLELTPYARDEYGDARQLRKLDGLPPLEMARLTYVVLAQSRDNSLLGKGFSHGGGTFTGSVADAFRNGQNNIPAVCERLRTVQIENRCAIDLLRQWDARETLFYLDPPYTLAQRSGTGYVHEMTDTQHLEMLGRARELKGMVLLSGYRNPLYAEQLELCGWLRRDFATVAHSSAGRNKKGNGHSARVESLWLNPAAAVATPQLFAECAAPTKEGGPAK